VDASVLVRVSFEEKTRNEAFWWPVDALRLVPNLIGSNAWVGLERMGDAARALHVSVTSWQSTLASSILARLLSHAPVIPRLPVDPSSFLDLSTNILSSHLSSFSMSTTHTSIATLLTTENASSMAQSIQSLFLSVHPTAEAKLFALRNLLKATRRCIAQSTLWIDLPANATESGGAPLATTAIRTFRFSPPTAVFCHISRLNRFSIIFRFSPNN
jgi:hypothetical protein